MACKKAHWKSGWPISPGSYYVQLVNGDLLAFRVVVARSFSTDEIGLDYDDGIGNSVWQKRGETVDCSKFWGQVRASYGPIPKYRPKKALV